VIKMTDSEFIELEPVLRAPMTLKILKAIFRRAKDESVDYRGITGDAFKDGQCVGENLAYRKIIIFLLDIEKKMCDNREP